MNTKHIIICILFLLVIGCDKPEEKNGNGWSHVEVFSVLEQAREEKKEEVIAYLYTMRERAKEITTDHEMLQYFEKFKLIETVSKSDEYQFLEHYVTNYPSFYDILMVNGDGVAFYSIRQESDFKKNLFSDPALFAGVKSQLDNNKISFIDYRYYAPSNESASFFAVQVGDKATDGWIILQLPIDQINRSLSIKGTLGQTGEIYLVNHDKLMMTDSRFMGDSSIFSLKVDTEAVKEAFTRGAGNRIIQDYRGVRVLSSFESFEIMGSKWIIIAEIDESEILTKSFSDQADTYIESIIKMVKRETPPLLNTEKPEMQGDVVEMGEFKKQHEVPLLSYGVSTCTAVIITLDGEFSYLIHIPPNDETYRNSGDNLLRELLSRIRYFELVPAKKNSVKFQLIATTEKGLNGTISTIVESGFSIDAIQIVLRTDMKGANIWHDLKTTTRVEWYNSTDSTWEETSDYLNVGDYFRRIKAI